MIYIVHGTCISTHVIDMKYVYVYMSEYIYDRRVYLQVYNAIYDIHVCIYRNIYIIYMNICVDACMSVC